MATEISSHQYILIILIVTNFVIIISASNGKSSLLVPAHCRFSHIKQKTCLEEKVIKVQAVEQCRKSGFPILHASAFLDSCPTKHHTLGIQFVCCQTQSQIEEKTNISPPKVYTSFLDKMLHPIEVLEGGIDDEAGYLAARHNLIAWEKRLEKQLEDRLIQGEASLIQMWNKDPAKARELEVKLQKQFRDSYKQLQHTEIGEHLQLDLVHERGSQKKEDVDLAAAFRVLKETLKQPKPNAAIVRKQLTNFMNILLGALNRIISERKSLETEDHAWFLQEKAGVKKRLQTLDQYMNNLEKIPAAAHYMTLPDIQLLIDQYSKAASSLLSALILPEPTMLPDERLLEKTFLQKYSHANDAGGKDYPPGVHIHDPKLIYPLKEDKLPTENEDDPVTPSKAMKRFVVATIVMLLCIALIIAVSVVVYRRQRRRRLERYQACVASWTANAGDTQSMRIVREPGKDDVDEESLPFDNHKYHLLT